MSPMIRLPVTTGLALLGFLYEKPMYGYEIHQRISDPAGLGQVWDLKQSQLYAQMAKMEEDGLVSTEIITQEARPPRKFFLLTPTGTQVYQEWLHSPVDHSRDMRLDFLVKLYFVQKEGPEAVRSLVERQREVCQHWIRYQDEHAALCQNPPAYEWYVRRFRAEQNRAFLAWLNTCQQALLP
jgi:PadR family transcriptional regulator, regulatory protein AphA